MLYKFQYCYFAQALQEKKFIFMFSMRSVVINSLIITSLAIWCIPVMGQSGIEWLSWEEAAKRSSSNPKKFLVDVYTDWCGWCRKMDANTFAHPEIARYINDNFYAIKFNAGNRDDIVWKGKTYKFVSNGSRGYHQLAAEIMQGQLSYPTVVFLNEDMEVIQPIPGYHAPDRFEVIVSYFAGNHYQTTPWRKYSQEFNNAKVVPVNGQ